MKPSGMRVEEQSRTISRQQHARSNSNNCSVASVGQSQRSACVTVEQFGVVGFPAESH